MRIGVLGPVEVRDGDRVVDLGSRRQRAILAALALAEGRPVSTAAVIDRVWSDRPPAAVVATLHGYVAGLRRALEPDRAPREEPRLLVTESEGYSLRLPYADRDATRLAQTVAEARTLIDAVPDPLRPRVAPTERPDVERAVGLLDDGLALWRGQPYADLADDPAAVAERTRLEGLRSAAEELRAVALLALGRHAELVGQLEAATIAHPLHERWWSLLAVALARAGRQGDALATLHTLRSLLADELGVDPSPPVRDLHAALLRQDPSVGWDPDGPSSTRPDQPLDPAGDGAPRGGGLRESPPLERWPLVGREAELARLEAVLDEVAAGRPATVLVTGESGVGKSRLVSEMAASAFARGFTVATGRCAADGSPTLWPWRTVVESTSRQLGTPGDAVDDVDATLGDADDFAAVAALARSLLATTGTGPVLLVLEDVQWADPASLRVLLALGQLARDEPLGVVVTLRQEADDARLGDVGAALARLGAVRVELGGLGRDAAAELVAAVAPAGAGSASGTAAELWERSRGNAFFLVELAQADGRVSGSLTDVVLSRVRALPGPTVEILDAAAVLEDVFDLDHVAYMLDRSVAETAEQLDPALRSGLVVDAGQRDATYAFAHRVVREVVHDAQPQAARAQRHRAAATVLEQHTRLRRPDQRALLAHHWEAAGHLWRGEAWRSVLRAAEEARGAASYAEEVDLLRRAVAWQRGDLRADDRTSSELLLALAHACLWAVDRPGLAQAVDEAVEVAERLDDVDLIARAVLVAVEGSLWEVRPRADVRHPTIAALERALHRLPEGGLRCRALVALAVEVRGAAPEGRVAGLVTTAVTKAEELGDDRVLALVHLGACVALDHPDHATAQVGHALAARAAAERLGDVRLTLLARAMRLSLADLLGDPDLVLAELPGLTHLTRDRGLASAEAVLRGVEVPWRSMRGDHEGAHAALTRLGDLARTLRVPLATETLREATVARAVLAGSYERSAGFLASFADPAEVPGGPVAMVVLLRAGRPEAARAVLEAQGIDLDPTSPRRLLHACLACELAAGLDERGLAERAYPVALPYAGRMCTGGTAGAIGPVDGFLVHGAVALGDRAAATRHADAAEARAATWRLGRIADELAATRARYAV